MLVLGIESTCDETAVAVVEDGKTILSNVISSQIDLHAIFGGVVPELASRRHIEVIIPTIEEALKEANVTLDEIDLIAASYGPGLIGALLVGLNTAKTLAFAKNIPFIGINHVEAHLYAALMSHDEQVKFPCLGAVLSGGHTTLLKMQGIGEYELISETVDDAVGEAFDKAAKILGLPYPGGPEIEALAKKGNPSHFPLKAGKIKNKPYHFSFSGLKTGVLYAAKDLEEKNKADLAASFQQAALQDIVKKTLLAAKEMGCETLIFGGGVTNNRCLRELFNKKAPELKCLWPEARLTLDNGAMIAGLGYHRYLHQGKGDSLSLEPKTRIAF